MSDLSAGDVNKAFKPLSIAMASPAIEKSDDPRIAQSSAAQSPQVTTDIISSPSLVNNATMASLEELQPCSTSLTARLNSVPQKLYDMIKKLVFTADDEPIKLTLEYKPPANMQVDKATRKAVLKQHFSNGTFADFAYWKDHDHFLPMWVASLANDTTILLMRSRGRGIGPEVYKKGGSLLFQITSMVELERSEGEVDFAGVSYTLLDTLYGDKTVHAQLEEPDSLHGPFWVSIR